MTTRSVAWAVATMLLLGGVTAGCRTDGEGSGPPVPASSDPEGKDLVVGAIVIAYEAPSQSYRLYKIKKVNYFPPPMGDELVLIALSETGSSFQHASDLWRQGKLTVAVPNARVQRQMFRKRDYRILEIKSVTEADGAAKAGEAYNRGS